MKRAPRAGTQEANGDITGDFFGFDTGLWIRSALDGGWRATISTASVRRPGRHPRVLVLFFERLAKETEEHKRVHAADCVLQPAGER